MRALVRLALLLPVLPVLIAVAPRPVRAAEPFLIERFTLPNGLTIWAQPRADSHSLVAMLVFRAGARYEAREVSGISHFVEHMLFTGTERWSEDEIKSLIANRGGRWNGWTGFERTTYFAQLGAQDLDLALEWLSQVAFHATFPAEKIDKERQVVFQEKSGRYGWMLNTLDQWGFGYELDRDVRRALFPGSALGQRIIGDDDSLDRIDRDLLLDYYRRHYTPANATLVLVGGFDMAELRGLVGRHFGDLPAGERPADPPAPSEPYAGPGDITLRGPLLTDQTTLMVGARTVGRDHPDRAALQVLGEMLSRELTQQIRYRRGLVYGLSAYNTSFDDAGYFTISTTSASGSRDEIVREITARLDALRAGKVDSRRVDEARLALAGRWTLSMEDNADRASYLAHLTGVVGPDEPIPDYAAQVLAVTPEDLARVARTYFTPERSYVARHVPGLTVASGAIGAAGVLAAGALAWGLRRRRR